MNNGIVICREGNVNYQEVHHTDQVALIIDEIKQRIVYGSALPNMCQCREEPMIQVNSSNSDFYFTSYEQLNQLYSLWKNL